ncbi:serine hydrolase [Lutibacter sp.]|uniref:serine hydrolase domain-containing protein n=1 Tax=Lutibacter sp. TaxID=1925666 RepID=UPI002602C991|nr:serine hydrolase domain-containing protein [uncultured Lutibacter sp.]
MKKFIKYTVLPLIIFLSIFILSTSKKENLKEDKTENVITSTVKKQIAHQIKKYPAKQTKKVSQQLDSLLQRINKRHDFHGSLLIAKDGKILYEKQIGYADFRKKDSLNASSIFQLASVSKQFTAAAIMLLYERNKIKLTDTVNRFFPDFPYKNVTITNLLNHTAGLPKYFWVAEHKWKQEKAPTNNEMMNLLQTSNVQRFFKPGRNFDYSNTGYFVLASIVEKVSEMSFSTFVKKNIFEPLGMKDSYIFSYGVDIAKGNQLDGYRLYRGWRHLKINSTINDAIVGDKNVYSTSRDLYKWILALNSGELLSKESLKLMYSYGKTMYGRKVPYGFGFRIDKDDKNMIYHHGKWNGFRTGVTQYLNDNLAIIILEHTSYNGISSLTKKVKKIVEENFVKDNLQFAENLTYN